MALVTLLTLILLSLGNAVCMKTYKDNINSNDFSWVYNSFATYRNAAPTLEEQLEAVLPKGAEREDMYRTFEEIASARGYPVETHQVRTEDGYLLTLHRIPHGFDGPSENRSVAFLQHGLLGSSVDYLIPGPSKGLGYLIVNLGYDAWFPNCRGNTYSRRHEVFHPDRRASEFWDFSWDEIGYYDIPAMIDYVLARTGQQSLFHVGYSQGTTSFYVMAARRPEYNAKIRAHFSLSPTAYMKNALSPVSRFLSFADSGLHVIMKLIGVYEFMPSHGFLASFAQTFCEDEDVTQMLCTNAVFAFAGFSRDQMNTSLLPIMLGHTPAGSSTKQVLHYIQLVNSGYLIVNLGYDVWFPNCRGNTYSRRHEVLHPDRQASEFWDFSWDEIGYYDIPAMIDYVLAHTGQQSLFHVGYSQGTTSFYVMAARRPEYNAKIRAHFSLSPAAYMKNAMSPVSRFLSFTDSGLHVIMKLIGVYEFLPSDGFLASFAQTFCQNDGVTQLLCKNALFALAGFSRDQMNTSLLPIMLGHTPAGSSTKQVLHYSQLVNSGRFCRWDYGLVGNYRKYGSLKPPDYNISQITAPIYFFYSSNDWLSDERDVLRLAEELPNLKGKFLNPDVNWNHLDFIYGKDIDINVNRRVVSLMSRH